MLTLIRSNRSEVLAAMLATNLSLNPPDVLEQTQVVVNTWPTSRWLGEQLALANPAGIAANLRFPFPTSLLRRLVEETLNPGAGDPGADPWRAQNLVWPLLDLMPKLLDDPSSAPLHQWLSARATGCLTSLEPALWQLARAMADAIDDYGLYRPAMVEAWLAGHDQDGRGRALDPHLAWQPQLVRHLHHTLGCLPFGLKANQLIRQMQQGWRPEHVDPKPLRLFGLSSLAPVQIALLQALSAVRPIELYLLSPCPDLWQRRASEMKELPLAEDWLLDVPGFEARFGRLGAEFQQLLEGSGETQLGRQHEQDLFFLPASAAGEGSRPSATLLEHLQEHLVDGTDAGTLPFSDSDRSLQFHACPGRLRQLQVMRDQILQLLAEDPTLEPRDVLVMTPQVEAFAPLVSTVFGDSDATGVHLPWRLTDRTQQTEAGITQALLQLLALGGDRLTASALESVLANAALLRAWGIASTEADLITHTLQEAGFRWGLDSRDRGGDPTHSLQWAIDRLTLGLIFPETPGFAPGETAPMALPGSLDQQTRWLRLLRQLQSSLQWLGKSRSVDQWVEGLREQLAALFGDGDDWAWELQTIHAALTDWELIAGASTLSLSSPVVGDVLSERLSEGSGRFGHRSGALTISALEPMRAIPHKVIVLMGLDAGLFPRQRQRPGFHLMERQRLLGDPNSGDQDRYALLEAVLSARQHLIVSWSNRDERTGERLEPSTPVRQWLDLLAQVPVQVHAASGLERSNFLPSGPWPPASCDRRLLQVRRELDARQHDRSRGLAFTDITETPPEPDTNGTPPQHPQPSAWDDLLHWITAPQAHWLSELNLHPKEQDKAVLDLEPFVLDERQRAALLRRELQGPGSTEARSLGPGASPDWLQLERGRGSLPAHTAGRLETSHLQARWDTLHACLEGLGEEHLERLDVGDYRTVIPRRGDQLVLIHPGRPRTSQRLHLWLQLLLAAQACPCISRGVLVGRDGHRFRALEQMTSPDPDEAADLLGQLGSWQAEFRTRCWPVPPETGWAFAAGEAKGRGWTKALEAWQGSAFLPGEREDAVQRICFGSDLPLSELLTASHQTLALQLFQPLLKTHRELRA